MYIHDMYVVHIMYSFFSSDIVITVWVLITSINDAYPTEYTPFQGMYVCPTYSNQNKKTDVLTLSALRRLMCSYVVMYISMHIVHHTFPT